MKAKGSYRPIYELMDQVSGTQKVVPFYCTLYRLNPQNLGHSMLECLLDSRT